MSQTYQNTTTSPITLPSDPALLDAIADLVEALDHKALLDLALNSLRVMEKRALSLKHASSNGGCVLTAYMALTRLVAEAPEARPVRRRRAAAY
ncbi:protein of unknown function [Magnetospirillum sp. XM-1]|uniref:hypothetical protein n=1 Tax=Magnetospirillum sp. XM-1 TaxID=1663591 RepID=UPI00073DB8AC|nr:hypothetical protein [Magnetospirillum sp. XM-1]CUW38807.1 protein of unknown function [Magnetospirillum sp. XM-1]